MNSKIKMQINFKLKNIFTSDKLCFKIYFIKSFELKKLNALCDRLKYVD